MMITRETPLSMALKELLSLSVYFRNHAAVILFVIQHAILLKAVYQIYLMGQSSVITAVGAVLTSRADLPAVAVLVTGKGYGYR